MSDRRTRLTGAWDACRPRPVDRGRLLSCDEFAGAAGRVRICTVSVALNGADRRRLPHLALSARGRRVKIRRMTANTHPTAQAEGLLSGERARRKPWYRRAHANLPKWFVDAPDGLDIEQKRALFDKTAMHVNRALAVGTICIAGTVPPAAAALVKHHWNAAALMLLSAFLACIVCIPMLRRKLLERQLRSNSRC